MEDRRAELTLADVAYDGTRPHGSRTCPEQEQYGLARCSSAVNVTCALGIGLSECLSELVEVLQDEVTHLRPHLDTGQRTGGNRIS